MEVNLKLIAKPFTEDITVQDHDVPVPLVDLQQALSSGHWDIAVLRVRSLFIRTRRSEKK